MSTTVVTKTYYAVNVVEAKSSLFIVSCLFLPLGQEFNFLYLFHFLFRDIRDATTSYILFFLVESIGGKVSRICSCVISFLSFASPCFLNFFDPIFSLCCVVMMWRMLKYISPLVMFISFHMCSC